MMVCFMFATLSHHSDLQGLWTNSCNTPLLLLAKSTDFFYYSLGLCSLEAIRRGTFFKEMKQIDVIAVENFERYKGGGQ